ncbi:DUF4262 domain-containing protein [Haloechinothrix sp. YIM 98757]|uniref:DUF4262 domain-containing protein n=1 Tax=Haloechinothrix aidingensis TaxID=2752311 RepID=A0A838AA68_9PSEU|nr:DUF4262 domain-containing protein [Haloechinothrix aidingensis]MBA0126029.1 DUF4262 domain-containing protein [Haloechinothrix aidingensis]
MAAVSTRTLTDDDIQLRDSLLAELDNRGNAVVSVPPEGAEAGFCFTAGAWWKHRVPEAVVIGLPAEMGPVLLDAYVDRAATGERFVPGTVCDDFFDGVPVAFERVSAEHYPQYFGSAFLLYPDGAFPALQIIVATPDGYWPWSAEAPAGFAEWQPLLTRSGKPESRNPHAGPPAGGES